MGEVRRPLQFRDDTLKLDQEFPAYKRSLIGQGRAFCSVTAPRCREKIAALAVDFLRDDCIVRSRLFTFPYIY